MKLNANERAWFPEEKPQYPCILGSGEEPPRDGDKMLSCQSKTLFRVIQDANEDELDNADRMLRSSLQPEFLDFLPKDLIRDPAISLALIYHSAVEGSPLHEWKWEVREAVNLPAMPQDQADEEMRQLSLESFLANLL